MYYCLDCEETFDKPKKLVEKSFKRGEGVMFDVLEFCPLCESDEIEYIEENNA